MGPDQEFSIKATFGLAGLYQEEVINITIRLGEIAVVVVVKAIFFIPIIPAKVTIGIGVGPRKLSINLLGSRDGDTITGSIVVSIISNVKIAASGAEEGNSFRDINFYNFTLRVVDTPRIFKIVVLKGRTAEVEPVIPIPGVGQFGTHQGGVPRG